MTLSARPPFQPEAPNGAKGQTVAAKRRNHVWHIDLTTCRPNWGSGAVVAVVMASMLALVLVGGRRSGSLFTPGHGVGDLPKAAHSCRRLAAMVSPPENPAALRRYWQARQYCGFRACPSILD